MSVSCPSVPTIRQFDHNVALEVELWSCDDDALFIALQAATNILYRFRKPSGTVLDRPGALLTNGSDGLVVYHTVGSPTSRSGDFDEVGEWKMQVMVETPSGTYTSSSMGLVVEAMI